MILDRILTEKKQEVKLAKTLKSMTEMKQSLAALPPARSLVKALDNRPAMGLIAEIKKGSPSKGIIRADFDPVEIAKVYTASGAAAISILTDEKFFFGSSAYLQAVRKVTDLPLLRKDFIIDPWQVYESRCLGADLILLIAAALDDKMLPELFDLATELGMECLVEIHSEEEYERVKGLPLHLLGINNRDLQTFQTDLNTTVNLCGKIRDSKGCKIVSESGINNGNDVKFLKSHGVDAVLVGESLMREKDIRQKVLELLGREGVA
ncbi:indole-3-glycerol phosphate synthase TrpC [Thermincola ferriacetica]